MLYFLMFFVCIMLYAAMKKNQPWPIYLFVALFPVLPEYFAIEISEALPLITAHRIIVLILIVYYFNFYEKNSFMHVLKKVKLKLAIILYFLFQFMANSVHIFETSYAIKEIFSICFEQLIVVIILVSVIKNLNVLYKAINIIVCISGIICILGIFESITGNNIVYLLKTVDRDMLQASFSRLGVERAEVSFGHSVYFGLYCAVIIPFSMYFYENTKKVKYIIIVLLNITALLFSGSRGASLAASTMIIVMIFNKKSHELYKYLKYIPIIILLLFALYIFQNNFFEYFEQLIKSMLNTLGFNFNITGFGDNIEGTESRIMQLSGITWLIMQNSIVFGLGAGAQVRGLVYYLFDSGWRMSKTYDVGYIGIIMDSGIVGFAGFIILFIQILVCAWKWSDNKDTKNLNNAFKYSILCYLVGLLSIANVERIFWTIVALFISYNYLIWREKVGF